MATNSFGKILQIHSFGESHGPSVGILIDGLPAGLKIDGDFIQAELDRRKPGQSKITTERKEEDKFQITSGVFQGQSTGHPIHILIPNKDHKPQDYDNIQNVYRPSHADYTYEKKYDIRDPFGGGRSSARITAGWVAAGAIAKLFLNQVCKPLEIRSFVSQIYDLEGHIEPQKMPTLEEVEANSVRCPDAEVASKMEEMISNAKAEGDSLGGIIQTRIANCPVGLGEPIFDKLQANLAKAMLTINACKGVQFGAGFDSIMMKGSEYNDGWAKDGDEVKTLSNNSGGIQGGISNGEMIYFDAAFRPTSTIGKAQNTINSDEENVILEAKGRHDPCVVPRAVPIVEAMTALVLADHFLLNQLSQTQNLNSK